VPLSYGWGAIANPNDMMIRGALGCIRGYTLYTNVWCFLTAHTSFVIIKQGIQGYTP